MSEIAEELERLAEEFGKRLEEHAALETRYRRDPDGMHMEAIHAAATDAWKAATKRLHERAAELRAQRSGPTYKPQPKPSEVRAGQWWGSLVFVNEPVRLTAVDDQHAHAMLGDGTRLRLDRVRLITDARWFYLGSDTLPAT